jgi:selenocysteine lyase/cysteine desulfurase
VTAAPRRARLGLADTDGLLPLGIAHYNIAAEIDRVLEAIEAVVAGGSRPSD